VICFSCRKMVIVGGQDSGFLYGTFPSASGRRMGGCRVRDSSMPIGCIIQNRGDIRSGITVPAIYKNVGMRLDHLLVTIALRHRVVWAEIDREARKGKPVPSDHALLVIDLDNPGHPFDAGWSSAGSRIAACRLNQR
jgi:hypothetical protein